jgi:glycosyltransferase involved in cell wall biosynthesis
VAIVTDALYPWHKGGKEIRYQRLLSRLPENGMDVVVYSMKWWDTTPEPINYDEGSLTYESICPRVDLYRESRRSIVQAFAFAFSTFRLLTRKFDVIEADHMPYLQLVPLRIVAWVRRVPLVLTWHEVWGRDGWRTYLGRAGVVGAMLERLCVRFPDAIITVSTGTAEKLMAIGARSDRLHVISSTLDFDELERTVPSPLAPELIFIGRLINHKNASVAIDATAILRERGYDVHLGVIGVGPEESRLKDQVESMGLQDRVMFHGAIESQQELWSLLRGSRVLLAPSTREGFGLIVAESLALGTPVVCVLHPDNESSKLVSPSIGSVVAPVDVVALADAAEYWLRDDSQRRDRRSKFRSDHVELTLDAMAHSYADVLRGVTAPQRK